MPASVEARLKRLGIEPKAKPTSKTKKTHVLEELPSLKSAARSKSTSPKRKGSKA